MNKEDYVSLEVSKLLKERGYEGIAYQYYRDGILYKIPYLSLKREEQAKRVCYNAPSLYDAQKWLRLNKNMHVCVDVNASGWYYVLSKSNNGTYICDSDDNGPNDGGCWDTYEEALNAGIIEAFKLI